MNLIVKTLSKKKINIIFLQILYLVLPDKYTFLIDPPQLEEHVTWIPETPILTQPTVLMWVWLWDTVFSCVHKVLTLLAECRCGSQPDSEHPGLVLPALFWLSLTWIHPSQHLQAFAFVGLCVTLFSHTTTPHTTAHTFISTSHMLLTDTLHSCSY